MSCTVDEKGNWHVGEMPDEALPPDSLVGTMLNADKLQPEAIAAAMEFMDEYDEDLKALAASERAELPLWREMLKAGMHAERCDPGTVRHSVAAEIEALRDWLFTLPCHSRYAEEYRQILTEQARIARGD